MATLPQGWEMRLPGFAADKGQTKGERKQDAYVRYCDARGSKLKVYSHDGEGVPHEVVLACIEAAADFLPEFKS